MSGRTIIIILAVSATLMGWFFYRTLQQSPQFKTLATEQMAMEYVTYTKTFQNVERLPVAETEAAKFFAPLKNPWKFELHDKTLVAFVPKLESEPPGTPLTPEILAIAKGTIEKSLLLWLEDKYHTKKDLKVEVQMGDQNYPTPD